MVPAIWHGLRITNARCRIRRVIGRGSVARSISPAIGLIKQPMLRTVCRNFTNTSLVREPFREL